MRIILLVSVLLIKILGKHSDLSYNVFQRKKKKKKKALSFA